MTTLHRQDAITALHVTYKRQLLHGEVQDRYYGDGGFFVRYRFVNGFPQDLRGPQSGISNWDQGPILGDPFLYRDEGITWIPGHHDEDSTEVQALRAAYALRA